METISEHYKKKGESKKTKKKTKLKQPSGVWEKEH